MAPTTQELLPQMPDCDAMIVRGATYLDLCRNALSVPVIELIINGTDIVNMLLQLRQKYGSVPAAVLGTQNMILGVEKLARQLNVDVTPYCFPENSVPEIRKCVEQAARDGKKVVIGGSTGCRLAEEMGLTSMLISSGREAFWNAISEAKQQAKISIVEREKALSLQTMLDNAYEGLVAIDRNRQISFLNMAAIQILQLSQREQYLGKPASTVFSTPTLNRIVSAAENTDEIIEYKNTHLSVKTRSLTMHGAPVGRVVSLLNAAQIQTTEDQLRKKLHYKGHQAKYSFDHLITRSPRMLECIQEAKAYALTDSNIVVVGETGTGKEVVARALHRRSGRTGEFVAINCGALPRDLLATELFGYEGGAFTGARETGAVGKFEFADGGTLFLDEIGEMPVDMQVSLLRVLQEQSVTKLGSNTAKTLDVRVIAATNQNIERLISEKKFRSDLYYRLSLVDIRLPQLRRRSADIPPLVDYFNGQLSSVLEVPCTPFPAETIEALQAYSWPGNVRELRNIVERCLIMQGQGANVTVDSLPPHIANAANAMPDGPVAHAAVAVQQDAGAMREGVEDDAVSEERHLVQALLAQHEGDLAAVGRQLGLTHEELSELLNRLHLRVRVVLESMDDAF